MQMILRSAASEYRPGTRAGPAMLAADSVPTAGSRSRVSQILRIAVLAALVMGAQVLGDRVGTHLQLGFTPGQNAMVDTVVLLVTLVYIVTMAMPFVPGIEIGLTLMLVLGPDVFPLVYACTQIALLLSFIAGRLLSLDQLAVLASWLHLERTRSTLVRLESMEPDQRLQFMLRAAPRCWLRGLVRHRYLALAVLINVPGNAIIGGAGGMGLCAGMSRVFSLPRYIMVMALATTPVPILLWIGHAM
ncbi:MAG: hypothetical protein U5K33_09975 [Halofilum sp. (in: g-proteobacteria)]|nr:hypothetical protein [Halofilum sp. (in: g-proteobacteria)]